MNIDKKNVDVLKIVFFIGVALVLFPSLLFGFTIPFADRTFTELVNQYQTMVKPAAPEIVSGMVFFGGWLAIQTIIAFVFIKVYFLFLFVLAVRLELNKISKFLKVRIFDGENDGYHKRDN